MQPSHLLPPHVPRRPRRARRENHASPAVGRRSGPGPARHDSHFARIDPITPQTAPNPTPGNGTDKTPYTLPRWRLRPPPSAQPMPAPTNTACTVARWCIAPARPGAAVTRPVAGPTPQTAPNPARPGNGTNKTPYTLPRWRLRPASSAQPMPPPTNTACTVARWCIAPARPGAAVTRPVAGPTPQTAPNPARPGNGTDKTPYTLPRWRLRPAPSAQPMPPPTNTACTVARWCCTPGRPGAAVTRPVTGPTPQTAPNPATPRNGTDKTPYTLPRWRLRPAPSPQPMPAPTNTACTVARWCIAPARPGAAVTRPVAGPRTAAPPAHSAQIEFLRIDPMNTEERRIPRPRARRTRFAFYRINPMNPETRPPNPSAPARTATHLRGEPCDAHARNDPYSLTRTRRHPRPSPPTTRSPPPPPANPVAFQPPTRPA